TGVPEEYLVYDGKAVMYIPLLIDENATGEITVPLAIQYQVCDDSICLIPQFLEREVTFRVVAAVAAAAEAPDHGALFDDFDPTAFAAIAAAEAEPAAETSLDTRTDSPNAEVAESPSSPISAASSRSFFGIPLPSPDSASGLLVFALLSAVGGFVLNLTPCVLPVLPIKVMTISKHAGSPGKSLVLGLWMALGVVAFWVALGVPVALATNALDPSRLFGIWWVTLSIGLVIAAMGVGIMGLFTINLPDKVYMVNPKADSAWGSFLFGVMTAVLGLPCFGFVAGALLAGAATMSEVQILTIFGSLGVGMALPYFVLSVKPSWVDKMPRTGPASELVKQVMGLLLLAAAAYFVGSGFIALVNEKPWLGKQLHWWT
ncbi:MAG: cytochrome c biogenesis protein CcdA, partial [Planctomycetota bacterium]